MLSPFEVEIVLMELLSEKHVAAVSHSIKGEVHDFF